MTVPSRAARAASRSTELPSVLAEWESLSEALVALDDRPLTSVQTEVARIGRALRSHCDAAGSNRSVRLVNEHRWFLASLDELDAFVAVLDADDHGGHRQALGQYGRILAEAVRRHLADEAGLSPAPPPSPPG